MSIGTTEAIGVEFIRHRIVQGLIEILTASCESIIVRIESSAMAYETFERTSVRVSNPTVSVTTDGRIAVNAAASRLLAKAGAKAVRILWDQAKCGIALQGAQKSDKNAFSVVFSEGRSAIIAAKGFLKHIGWSADRRQTVSAKWNEQQKMLEAQLPSSFVGWKNGTPRKEDSGL